MTPVVRAIDVGYGSTKFTTAGGAGERIDCGLIPSVAVSGRQAQLSEALGAARRNVRVEIDGLQYEVGHDAKLAQGPAWSPNMSDDYCTSSEYLALVRAALHYMQAPLIDLLVLGLPVSTYTKRRHELKGRMTGGHQIGPKERVTVGEVAIVAQPCGALMHFLKHSDRLEVRTQRNLVIDCGSRTFDWVVADGMQVRDEWSGSINRGMHDVVETIARAIGETESVSFNDLDRIDSALRQGRKPLVFGKEYSIEPFLQQARKATDEALVAIKKYVGQGSEIDNIVAAGGGAFFFLPAIQAAFPRHTVHTIDQPVFANVRGFQAIGEACAFHFGRRYQKDVEEVA